MPPREPTAVLEDVRAQLADILAKVAATEVTSLLEDADLQAILERRFEILGEALRRLAKIDAATFGTIPGASEAIGLRNIIAHGYDSVDHRLLWSIATQHLPAMQPL